MQRVDKIPTAAVSHLFQALFEVSNAPLVYEAYSEFDQSTVSFATPSAMEEYAENVRNAGRSFLDFAVYYPEAEGEVLIRTISLQPKKCKGATWREKVEGWGVIQFWATYLPSDKVEVRISVNSEKRANLWAETYPEMGSPSLWDWKYVEKQCRRLIRVLRRLAQTPPST